MIEQTERRLPTHLFLASLGKTRLRPGGKHATDRLIEKCGIGENSNVLEVAPNMGTTAIELVKKYNCHVTGIDLHQPSLEKARENVMKHGLEDKITLVHGNAIKLPFEDITFDVVINEAMLSMLPHEMKQQAISEYYRVLKPGGRLATHDLLLHFAPSEETLQALRKLLHVNAQPLLAEGWEQLFNNVPFSKVDYDTGKMTLLSLKGLIDDEGWEGIMTILQNAQANEDSKEYLYDLISTFDEYSDLYGHITFYATK